MYELFEHTADLGIRVRAPDLDTLFAEAGEALFAALLEDVRSVRLLHAVPFRIAGEDRALLLCDWLRALLLRFDEDHFVFGRFRVHVGEDGLEAEAWGEPFDLHRHRPGHEVKAITYHGLKVEPTPDGWLAEVIVDI